MLFTCTFEDGELQTIHPNPKEVCNVDDAGDVRKLTLGELAHILVQQQHVGLVETVDALICQHCGGD